MFSTLQDMEHHCQTSFGVSESSFGGDVWTAPHNPPPQGAGQGNGAGPPIWATTSSPLFDMMREDDHGAHFTSAISEELLHIAGSAFVDDTDLAEKLAALDATMEETIQKAQEGLDLFVGAIGATGGQVRPDKSWWYPLCFCWRQGVWYYDVSHPGNLSVDRGDGTKCDIERLTPDEAREMLGVWIAPDGNNKKAVEELVKKTTAWADQVRTKHIRREDAWRALNTTIMKSLEYTLTALTLSEQDCRRIEAPLRKYAFPQAGIGRTFPHAVVNGPSGCHGLGFRRLFYKWGEKHIEAVVKHLLAESVTGKFMRACLEAHQLEVGLGTHILETQLF